MWNQKHIKQNKSKKNKKQNRLTGIEDKLAVTNREGVMRMGKAGI